VVFEGEVRAVIELASFEPFTTKGLALLDQLSDQLGVIFDSTEGRMRTEKLLAETQSLANALRMRTEETMRQSEELLTANAALEQRTKELEAAQRESLAANRDLLVARDTLRERAEELDRASRYKSDFLANMSHELRTPLNSILILSSMLASGERAVDGGEGRKYATTINEAGHDLLQLINDILDLSKIEAGKARLEMTTFRLRPLVEALGDRFRPLAEEKGLDLVLTLVDGTPVSLTSDADRLRQVLNNLIGNAIKFTERGRVTLEVAPGDRLPDTIDFTVRDTGIGIPHDQQELVFEAFQQASVDASRGFGGTGLGLSISRQICDLLGGTLTLESSPGTGSSFTLTLPLVPPDGGGSDPEHTSNASPQETSCEDGDVQQAAANGHDTLLLIENDSRFVDLMTDLAGRHGFEILATDSPRKGIELAESCQPMGIILDIQLPEMDGWEVLRTLGRKKATRHIPVQVMSVVDERGKAAGLGAVGHFVKPVSTEQILAAFERFRDPGCVRDRRLLVVKDPKLDGPWSQLPRSEHVAVATMEDCSEARTALESGRWDVLIFDGREDGRIARLEGLATELGAGFAKLSVILLTDEEVRMRVAGRLDALAARTNLRVTTDPEALLIEAVISLHLPEEALTEAQRAILHARPRRAGQLAGRTVLIVDDDIRNIYALTSALEARELNVLTAGNGREALDCLEREDEAVDVVLMDITMPVMDGREAIRRIRRQARFARLPIIAMAEQTMRGDRHEYLVTGASDFLIKPINPESLVLLLEWRLGSDEQGGSDDVEE
jgi:signal transduction histidine kinase/CheY-like chemotaxis protein